MIYSFNIIPIGKPRMTRRDKWKKRPVINNYYAFKDELNLKANLHKYSLTDILIITFYLPMPQSWSKKKRLEMNGMPHRQKPDFDNLVKAFTDALTIDDSMIWNCTIKKYWSDTPRIVVVQ